MKGIAQFREEKIEELSNEIVGLREEISDLKLKVRDSATGLVEDFDLASTPVNGAYRRRFQTVTHIQGDGAPDCFA